MARRGAAPAAAAGLLRLRRAAAAAAAPGAQQHVPSTPLHLHPRAQADALAYGKTPEQLRSENVPDYLIPHRSFTGNRPSMSILLPELDAFTVGQLLSLYEHRVAVQVRACLRRCRAAAAAAVRAARVRSCLAHLWPPARPWPGPGLAPA
jgi:hypothetical protein